MIIDEGDEQTPIVEEKPEKIQTLATKLTSAALTTINSLVEKEISKTLNETEKLLANNNISPDKIQSLSSTIINSNNSTQPPPLVTLTKARSPSTHSHNQQTFLNKGSIMRGTPISPSNKPISIDTSTNHPHVHPHHYSSPRNDYPHHPSTYFDSSHMKSSKMIDQQQLYSQQQAAYMRHYSHQQGTHNNFPPSSSSSQYLQQQQQQQQQHKSSSINNQQQQQQTSTNTNKSIGIDTSNTDTYETLRADFVTSRYLTTTHSPNHER